MNPTTIIAAILGLSAGSDYRRQTREFHPVPRGPYGAFGKTTTLSRNFKARHRFKQPDGYYSQVITDDRHKKPSQRMREAAQSGFEYLH